LTFTRGALGQSVAVSVPAGVGRLFARRRVAGNSCALRGNQIEIVPLPAARRGKNEAKTRTGKELLADPKERAEHVMLVDLARNDIGRVCDFGSVVVKELMTIERYSHSSHRNARRGQTFRRQDDLRLMRATFPADRQRRAENPRDADHLRT